MISFFIKINLIHAFNLTDKQFIALTLLFHISWGWVEFLVEVLMLSQMFLLQDLNESVNVSIKKHVIRAALKPWFYYSWAHDVFWTSRGETWEISRVLRELRKRPELIKNEECDFKKILVCRAAHIYN